MNNNHPSETYFFQQWLPFFKGAIVNPTRSSDTVWGIEQWRITDGYVTGLGTCMVVLEGIDRSTHETVERTVPFDCVKMVANQEETF